VQRRLELLDDRVAGPHDLLDPVPVEVDDAGHLQPVDAGLEVPLVALERAGEREQSGGPICRHEPLAHLRRRLHFGARRLVDPAAARIAECRSMHHGRSRTTGLAPRADRRGLWFAGRFLQWNRSLGAKQSVARRLVHQLIANTPEQTPVA
jgi:hypothetical protein